MSHRSVIRVLRTLTIGFAVSAGAHALAADNAGVSSDLENLGSNKTVSDRAESLETRSRSGIVQGRTVDRNLRFELGANYGPSAFGDGYLSTHSLGLRADFHLSPRWSFGVQYGRSFNDLTPAAKLRFDQARVDSSSPIPQVAYPEDWYMAVVNWYMLYGKLNLFDWRTLQFDVYSLAGYGRVKVSTDLYGQTYSDWSDLYTAGIGTGFWLTQHFSMRTEIRYQYYSDKVYTGSRDQNQAVATLGLGWLI